MPDPGERPPAPPANFVAEVTCKERQHVCARALEKGMERLTETQKEHRKEFREDFRTFATKTEQTLDQLVTAQVATATETKANTGGIKTLSARGWGLFVVVLLALLSGVLGLVFSMAVSKSAASAAPATTTRNP